MIRDEATRPRFLGAYTGVYSRFRSLDVPPLVERLGHTTSFEIYRHRAEVEDGVLDGIKACGDKIRIQNQRLARARDNRVGVGSNVATFF
jgi:hypothetical protein